MNRRDVRFLLSGISVLFSLVYIWYVYRNILGSSSAVLQWLNVSNVRIYASAIIVLIAVFLLLSILYEIIGSKNEAWGGNKLKVSYRSGWIITIAVVFVSAFFFAEWLLIEQFKEKGVLNGNFDNIPFAGYVIVFAFYVVWVYITERGGSDISKISVLLAYGISVFWTFLLYYVPNQFNISVTDDWSNNITSSIPATETIYNAVDGVPFNISTTGLYGHYSIFFIIPFKLLGTDNPYSIGIMLVIVACLSQVAVIYVIDTFLPKNWLKVLFAFASILFVNFYFAGCYPIRTFFPAITCAFLAYLYKKDVKAIWDRNMLIGIVLSSLSLVWNFENGVACTFSFAMYVSLRILQREEKFLRKIILSFFTAVFIFFTSLSMALMIVNIWNIIFGGQLIFSDFFYPLIPTGDNYMLNLNRCNVDLGNHLWVYILALLFGSLCVSVHKILFKSGKEEEHSNIDVLVGAISTMGIIAFSYYMNEAHWGATYIVHYIIICMCAVLINKFYQGNTLIKCDSIVSCIKRGGYIFIICAVSIFAINTINIPVVIDEKVETRAYSLSNAISDIEEMKSIIPENTYGIGMGINIIYHILGWNNHAKYRDDTSMHSSDNVTLNKAIDELCSQEEFVISHFSQRLLEEAQKRHNYEQIAVFEVDGWEYGYYRKTD